MKKKPTVALVLGGGGARGLAHLGVIQALKDAGIRPDLVVGSSSGALMGAAYAANAETSHTLERVQEVFDCEPLTSEASEDSSASAPTMARRIIFWTE